MQYTSSAHRRLAQRAGNSLLLFLLLTPVVALAGLTAITSPDPVPFPDTLVGTTSSGLTVTVENTSGAVAIMVTAITFSGTNSGDFAVDGGTDNCTGQSIAAAGGTCTFDIVFAPGAAGARTASVDFTSSPVDGIVPSATLNGTGTEPAVGLDTPSPLDLGSWNVGATSTAATVILENTGTADLTVATLGISGANMGDYMLGGNTCDDAILTPTSTCTFQITLTPSAGGTRTAQVDIPSDAPTSPDVLELTGTGIVVGPAVGLSPDPVDFGGVDVGVPSGATTVTLTNTGNQTLNVGPLGVSGTNAGDFAISADTCSNTPVDASLTCTFDVTFTPGAQDARSGQVDIPSDAPTSPDALALSGTGTGVGLSLSPGSLNFGARLVGSTSGAQTVTLDNTGTVTLNIGSLGVAGTKGAEFALVADNCSGQAVAGGGSCTFGVTFTPGTTGARTDEVTVPSDAPSSPDTVALSGTGITPGGGFDITAGMSGSFFDPNFNGQGINIEILGQQEKGAGLSAVVYWYGFDGSGYPFFSFGVGDVVHDTIQIEMLFDYDGAGPFFGPGWNPDQFAPVRFALAVITGLDCNNLLFEFTPVDPVSFPPHLMVMERITDVVGAGCGTKESMIDDAKLTPADKGVVSLLRARSGSYYDPAFNGQGINIEVLDIHDIGANTTASVLVYWYGFDPRGFPFFAFGVGTEDNNVLTVSTLIDYDGTGPFFGPAWDPSQFDPVGFADVTITWTSCPQGFGTMTFDVLPAFEDIFIEHAMSLQRITTLAGTSCP